MIQMRGLAIDASVSASAVDVSELIADANALESLLAERNALIASLKEIDEAVAEQVDLFGRYGEVCSFEGNSMIYAETLMELGDKVASIVERHSRIDS